MIHTPAKQSRKFFLALMLLCLLPFTQQATHIVGGDLNYEYVGNNRYVIRLTVYRDCYNGIPPFDNPAALGIFDSFNNLITSIPMNFPGSDTIPPLINSPCFIPPTDICYERTTYVDTITLPPRLQGYQLAYQRCCRNMTIRNIVIPQWTGATYYASVPTAFFAVNSNPVFKNWPPPFICLGIPFVFDHSATDADGDSIAYEICTPLTGADTTNSIPQPPNPPPYDPVTYIPPYNNGNLLGGVPLTINPVTGELTCTPNNMGQYVVGICAREFRNGIYLSTTRRDFQLNVVACPTLVVAALQNPILNCRSNSVTFENHSLNAGSYYWNFGDPTTLSDTSHAVNPSYVYPDTGTYQVTLIAYSNINPGCADTTIGTVTLLPEYEAAFSYTMDTCSNIFTFRDSSNNVSGTTNFWNWDFQDGTSNIHNPVHQFTQPGNYQVTLYSQSSRGCPDTVSQPINVPALLGVNATTAAVRCKNECNGIATATTTGGNSPFQYLWNNSQITSTASNLCAGTYTVTVTDFRGCINRDTIIVTEPDSLRADIVATPAYCHGDCIGTAQVTASGGNGGFTYLWNDPQAQQTQKATQLCAGNFQVTVKDSRGCEISLSTAINYSDSIPDIHASADTNVIYQGQSVILHAQPLQGNSFAWTPSSSLNNAQSANPVASPQSNTTYTVLVTDENQCTNSDTVSIIVKDVLCDEPELFIPNAFSPNNDFQNDILFVRGNTIETMNISIFDRWGEKVFESDNKSKGWDGTYKGSAVTPGVFVYYLEIGCYNKEHFTKKGNITVIR